MSQTLHGSYLQLSETYTHGTATIANKPILMLQSREDKYSLPSRAKDLYDLCTAPKRLVYFRKGAHSHIKINAPEKYDGVIIDFLRELCHNNTITDGIIGDET